MSKKTIGREVVKLGVVGVTSYGTGYIIGRIVGAFMPPELKLPAKVCCVAAAVVVSDILVEKEYEYIDHTLDEVFDAVDELKEAIRKTKEEDKSSSEEEEKEAE